jgi:hypothetical protein
MRKDYVLEQKAVVRAHAPRQPAKIKTEALRHLLQIGRYRRKSKPLRRDGLSMIGRGGQNDRKPLALQALSKRNEACLSGLMTKHRELVSLSTYW